MPPFSTSYRKGSKHWAALCILVNGVHVRFWAVNKSDHVCCSVSPVWATLWARGYTWRLLLVQTAGLGEDEHGIKVIGEEGGWTGHLSDAHFPIMHAGRSWFRWHRIRVESSLFIETERRIQLSFNFTCDRYTFSLFTSNFSTGDTDRKWLNRAGQDDDLTSFPAFVIIESKATKTHAGHFDFFFLNRH